MTATPAGGIAGAGAASSGPAGTHSGQAGGGGHTRPAHSASAGAAPSPFSEFGNRNSPWNPGIEFHSGIDIRAERGTPIYAPANGSVVLAGTHQEYGNAIILDHGQDVRSLYGHLSKLNVQPGQRVERGALVGWTGNTGRSSGPHLHYEILVRGQAVNPRAYLWD